MSTRLAIGHGQLAKPNTFYQDAGNGEYYIAKSGITYSDPRIAQHFNGHVPDGEVAPPWLAQDTAEVVRSLGNHAMVVLEGDLGAGKSTVLHGVRAELRRQEQPYVVINGHFLNRRSRIASAVGRAAKADQTVIYESLDWNYIDNRRTEAKKIRPVVEDAIEQHLADGGKVLATTHTAPWFGVYSNPALTTQFREFIGETGAFTHRVHGLLDHAAQQYIGTLNCGPEYGELYTSLAATSAEPTAHTYRVLKLFGLQHASEISGFDQASFDDAVRTIDAETRAKMGAPAHYSFLPQAL